MGFLPSTAGDGDRGRGNMQVAALGIGRGLQEPWRHLRYSVSKMGSASMSMRMQAGNKAVRLAASWQAG